MSAGSQEVEELRNEAFQKLKSLHTRLIPIIFMPETFSYDQIRSSTTVMRSSI